jgi:predicted porin
VRGKFKLAATAAAAMCMNTAASAQSSVTIYGIIDYGINYVNNAQVYQVGAPNGRVGGRQWFNSSSILQGNRLGFRGAEDLGGGYSAFFVLENGFDVGTGRFQQGGDLFGRQAYVGVGAPYGKVTFGRQYDEMVDYLGPISAAAYNGAYADHPSDLDNVGNDFRANNAVKFTSLKYAGFAFSGLFGFGNNASSFATSSVKSFGASYSYGQFTVALAYLNANSPNQSFWGNNATSSTTGNNLGAVTGVTSNPIIAGFASARTLETYGLAGTYVTGPVTSGFTYTKTRFEDLNSPTAGTLSLTNPLGYTGSASFDNYSLFSIWYITPSLYVSGAYDYLAGGRINGKPDARYHTFNATVTYFLSKRTSLYFNGNYQRALGVDSTGKEAVASMVAVTPSNTGKQVVARIGIRHLF